jgi:putative intracellular protease/amidase
MGLFLPGGMPGGSNLAQSEMLIAFIRKMNNSNKLLAAICARFGEGPSAQRATI